MNVTIGMIHPQLRVKGILARIFMRPSERFFRKIYNGAKKTAGKNIEGIDCSEIQIPRSDGTTIRTRVYKPINATEPLPVLLYIHGGGYFMGTPESFNSNIKMYIQTRPCVVVSPDYRKSFDAPYPAAIDDCYDTLQWIRDNASSIGGNPQQIITGGHSAGGGLTAALSFRARDRGEVDIAFQMPVYPMIDDRMITASATDNNAPMWNSKANKLGWNLYLSDLLNSNTDVPYDAAPARATDYSNLPPTMTLVGDLDPFRDETIEYVENLKKAGVPVQFKRYEGCFHGFDIIAPKSTPGADALKFTMESFANAVDNLR